MDNFDDLNDEIGADDWLIPKQEITRRKLIKQTSRFKIYRADWFGDVLVYEPIAPGLASRRRGRQSHKRRVACHNVSLEQRAPFSPPVLSGEGGADACESPESANFRSRLAELCLGLSAGGEGNAPAKTLVDETPERAVDSAYSSLSSTPQYHTKHNSSRGFEFPLTQTVSLHAAAGDQQETPPPTPRLQSNAEGNLPRKSTSSSPALSPVVLNRRSFTFGACCQGAGVHETLEEGRALEEEEEEEEEEAEEEQARNLKPAPESTCATTSAGWFELNELRLVAHENFMLFMGASLGEEARTMNENMEQSASLVMQMSHPKAISLRDLLHATPAAAAVAAEVAATTAMRVNNNFCDAYSSTSLASGQLSSLDRFFNARHYLARPAPRQRQRPLTVEAKLNICQQVTNAMTYLHDKNIVHGRLTSVNIYIELNQRVKISLLDNDEQQIVLSPCAATRDGRCDHGQEHLRQRQCQQVASFNLPALTYLSPELVRTISVLERPAATSCESDCDTHNHQGPEVHMDTARLTREADIFAFGTLLFELFEERFPFSSAPLAAPATPSALVVFASPEARRAANAKLFDTLCLESAVARSPTSPAAGRSPLVSPLFIRPGDQEQQQQQQQQQQQSWSACTRGNIKVSASELIYQIGSGQIAESNRRTGASPALVDHIISACWRSEARARPSFKQLKFEQ